MQRLSGISIKSAHWIQGEMKIISVTRQEPAGALQCAAKESRQLLEKLIWSTEEWPQEVDVASRKSSYLLI